MSRPNIVWLMGDHLVYAHHRELSGYPKLPTYDRLAAEGISFSNSFSVTPLCQPARASMLTGVYPHRHGMFMNDGEAGARLDFDAGARLFGHNLREAGYRTGYFGKWHAGEVRIARDYGFEGFSCPGYGHPYWSAEYTAYLEEKGLPQAQVTIEWWVGEPSWQGRTIRLADFPQPYESPYLLMESSGVLNTPVETHEAYFLAHEAIRWLEETAGEERPFFLRVDTWGPHHPFWVGEPFLDTVDPAALPEYPSFGSDLAHRPAHHRALLEYRRDWETWRTWDDFRWFLARAHEHAALVDAAVGQIVEALDRLGLAENTMVIYTADHGGALASNGLLVDKGWVMTDETVRIPLAIRWPGQIRPGNKTDQMVMNMDLVPTVLEAASATMPSPIDGRSLLALCRRPETAGWREDIMLQHHGHYGEPHFQRQLRHGSYKYVAHLDDREELYELVGDPYELENLAETSQMRVVLEEMRHRLRRQMIGHDDDGAQARRLLDQVEQA